MRNDDLPSQAEPKARTLDVLSRRRVGANKALENAFAVGCWNRLAGVGDSPPNSTLTCRQSALNLAALAIVANGDGEQIVSDSLLTVMFRGSETRLASSTQVSASLLQ
ncbi:MAG: hypothetical protein ACI8UO_000402 [Verrucomicrobiales bacterium]|jgi:hypothetical protein